MPGWEQDPAGFAALPGEGVPVRFLIAALVLILAAVPAGSVAVPGPNVVLGPQLDPAQLPALPDMGLALQVGDSVVLVRIDGRVIGHLDGLALDTTRSQPAPGPLILVDRSARRLLLEPRRHRLAPMAAGVRIPLAYGSELVQRRAGEGWEVVRRGKVVLTVARGAVPVVSAARDVVSSQALATSRQNRRRAVDLRTGGLRNLPRGCVVGAHQGDRWLLLCLKQDIAVPTSAYLPRVIARLGPHGWRGLLGPGALGGGAPHQGYWRTVSLSPDGTQLLAEWSGECGTPTAVLADSDGTHARRVAPHGASEALGFLPGGAALVAVPPPSCAGAGLDPGIYRVSGKKPVRLYPLTRRVAAVALWRSLS
jgi:hypothetical protein